LEFPKAVNPVSCPHNIETLEDKDLDYARKLQASFGKYIYNYRCMYLTGYTQLLITHACVVYSLLL
jgi:hypothetical protein